MVIGTLVSLEIRQVHMRPNVTSFLSSVVAFYPLPDLLVVKITLSGDSENSALILNTHSVV